MTLNIHEGRDGWPECVAVAVVLGVRDVFSDFLDVWRLPEVHQNYANVMPIFKLSHCLAFQIFQIA